MYCATCGHQLHPLPEGGFACTETTCAERGVRQEGITDGATIRTPFPFSEVLSGDAPEGPSDERK